MKHHQTRVEGRSASALLRRDKEPRAGQTERYEPVREFERATSYCPLYLAWRILAEVTVLLIADGSASRPYQFNWATKPLPRHLCY
jgi:hypothetical protein